MHHKELEKIIPEKYRDMVLILDDNAEVWRKYRDNLVQVYPYLFWHKEDDNQEIRRVNYPDYYLHYLDVFLQRTVALYKRYKAEHSIDALKLQRIVKIIHLHLFNDFVVHFTCFVAQNSPEEVLTLRESKIIKQREGKITFNADECNILIANTFKATKKIKSLKAKGIPTVHGSWIRYSVINLCPLSTDFFDVSNLNEEKFKDPKIIERELYDAHPEE